jgi:hypothetical protein
MPACFIIMHIVAALAAALFVIGLISVIKGFVFKVEKTIKTGTIMLAIAVFFLAGSHMMGRMHKMKACGDKEGMEMKCGDDKKEKCGMSGHPGMNGMDMPGEGHCKMMMMMKDMDDKEDCDMSKCDTSMCKKEVKVEIKKTK